VVTQAGAGTAVVTGAASYTGGTVIGSGVLSFGGEAAHSIGGVTGSGTLKVEAGAVVVSDGVNMPTGSWEIEGAQEIRAGAGSTGACKVSSLILGGDMDAWTGSLDLHDNVLVVESDGTNKAALFLTLFNEVNSAAGQAIITTTVHAGTGMAVVDNGAYYTPITSFRGLSLDANSVVVVQALRGDANLDGTVNFADFATLLQNYNAPQSTRVWNTGNTTNQGNTADLTALLQNYGQQLW
jgi:autotransporter-associated beta strand protein